MSSNKSNNTAIISHHRFVNGGLVKVQVISRKYNQTFILVLLCVNLVFFILQATKSIMSTQQNKYFVVHVIITHTYYINDIGSPIVEKEWGTSKDLYLFWENHFVWCIIWICIILWHSYFSECLFKPICLSSFEVNFF